MSWPGDWSCRSCQHWNFKKRSSCQLCGEPKCGDIGDYGNSGGRGGMTIGSSGSDALAGDWYCSTINCGALNFASRTKCFKCDAIKDESDTSSRPRGSGSGDCNRPGWKAGDWICTRPGCNQHNFASRMECHRCYAPRDFGYG